jgi:hypothetical protein
MSRGIFNSDEDRAISSLLSHLAAQGLAKCGENAVGSPYWSCTERLDIVPPYLADVSLRRPEKPQQSSAPIMIGSLKIMIEKFVSCANSPDLGKNRIISEELALIAWATRGLAECNSILDDDSEGVWLSRRKLCSVSSAQLFEDYPKFHLWLRKQLRHPRIASDLKEEVRRQFGTAFRGRRSSRIQSLFALEMLGYAVAYLDDSGRLAWKSAR